MKPACAYAQRKLSHLAVLNLRPDPGSWLERHVCTCRTCCTAMEEFQAVLVRLVDVGTYARCEVLPRHPQCAVQAPCLPPTASLCATRSQVLRPRFGTFTASFVLAGLALVLVLALWRTPYTRWRVDAGLSVAEQAGGIDGAPSPVVVQTSPQPSRISAASLQAAVSSSPQRAARRAGTKGRQRHRHRVRPRTWTCLRFAATGSVVQPAPQIRFGRSVSACYSGSRPFGYACATGDEWLRWGACYEQAGDYTLARWAYEQAYASSPHPEVALKAGQAAETAGDVPGAIAMYVRALTGPRIDEDTSRKGS